MNRPPAAQGAVSAGPISAGQTSNEPGHLNLVHSGSRVLVGFNYKEMPDESRVARYRVQLLDFVQRTSCKSLTFDMKGIKIVPSRMLGFFVSLKTEGHDVELVDMEQAVQDVFRITKLAQMFEIRPMMKDATK
jgi:anti-anti-sigma regulatory factor